VRLRKRAAALLVGAGVLFLIGTMVQAGWLYVIAALMLGAIAAGTILPLVALRGISADLLGPAEVPQEDETPVELRLTNHGRGVRWSVVARDEHLQPADVFLAALGPRERIEIATMRTPARRGEIATSRVTLRSGAPFGVAERTRRLPVEARTLVLPRVVPLGDLPFLEPVGTTEPAVHTAPRRGQGPDYLAVREYRPGDSMRHVHWGLTAHHGRVMVREFEEERTRRLAIVVDTELDTGEGWTPLDRCCTVAASLLEAALARGHGARLIAAGPEGEVEILARLDGPELVRWLARLRPSGLPIAPLLARLGYEELRGVESVVVAFPAWRDRDVASLLAAAGRLTSIVDRVVLVPVLLDDAPWFRGAHGVDPGVQVRPWGPNQDLAGCLGAFEARA
jgi:uncharacterized protein (DUF58 family)